MYKAALLLALVLLAMLVGCAGPAPRRVMACALVDTGTATFGTDTQQYPLLKLVCDEEAR